MFKHKNWPWGSEKSDRKVFFVIKKRAKTLILSDFYRLDKTQILFIFYNIEMKMWCKYEKWENVRFAFLEDEEGCPMT